MTAILKEDPSDLNETNPKIGLPLDRTVRRCLEKKPEQRFQSASDLGFALEMLATPSGAWPDTQPSSATREHFIDSRFLSRQWSGWVLAGLGFLIAFGALVFT